MGRTRYQATYGELFQTHLEREIERGGLVQYVVGLVEVYQRRDEVHRRSELEQWLQSTGAFSCNRCGDVFSSKANRDEDDPVLCWSCEQR
jgi:hypothetical protein